MSEGDGELLEGVLEKFHNMRQRCGCYSMMTRCPSCRQLLALERRIRARLIQESSPALTSDVLVKKGE